MKFVVDTNIAFSAVLNTEGKIGDLLMNSQGLIEFHSCDTLRSELKKHGAKLVRDVDMNDIAFLALSEFLNVKLWTGDLELLRGLAKKGYSNIITTDELYKLRSFLE